VNCEASKISSFIRFDALIQYTVLLEYKLYAGRVNGFIGAGLTTSVMRRKVRFLPYLPSSQPSPVLRISGRSDGNGGRVRHGLRLLLHAGLCKGPNRCDDGDDDDYCRCVCMAI
jgi:hypothetical protein